MVALYWRLVPFYDSLIPFYNPKTKPHSPSKQPAAMAPSQLNSSLSLMALFLCFVVVVFVHPTKHSTVFWSLLDCQLPRKSMRNSLATRARNLRPRGRLWRRFSFERDGITTIFFQNLDRNGGENPIRQQNCNVVAFVFFSISKLVDSMAGVAWFGG